MAQNEIRVLSDLSLIGSLNFSTNFADFPIDPSPRTMVVVKGVTYLYTELVYNSGYFSWQPIGLKQTSYLHTQGVSSTVWTVTHNFNSTNFAYFVYDTNHNMMFANIEIVNENTAKILLSEATAGTAVFFSIEYVNTQVLNAATSVGIGTLTLRDANGILTTNNNPVAMAQAVSDTVAAEAAARTLGDSTALTAANSYTAGQLAVVVSDFTSAVTNVSNSSTAYTDTKVAEEAARAEAAESALGSRIDSVISNTDPAALDSLTEVVTAFQSADSNMSNAITALGTSASSALAAEVTRAESAESLITSNLTTEVAARIAADAVTLATGKTYTDNAVSLEVTARNSAISSASQSGSAKLITARTINGVSFDGTANIIFGTDAVFEGSTNKYYTDSRVRSAISVVGSGSYNSTTGVITVTGGVTSVAGKIGAIVLTATDVTGVATSGANSNITSLTGLTTALSVAQGGTGVTISTGTGANVLSASPIFTGTPTAPTANAVDNSTALATTAFVKSQNYTANGLPLSGGTMTGTILMSADARIQSVQSSDLVLSGSIGAPNSNGVQILGASGSDNNTFAGNGGNITVTGGRAGNSVANAPSAGIVTITGGQGSGSSASGTNNGVIGGAVYIIGGTGGYNGGSGGITGNGGNVIIQAGLAGTPQSGGTKGTAGSIIFQTSPTGNVSTTALTIAETGAARFSSTVTASSFSGVGSSLTSLTGANVTGTVPLATSAVTISGVYSNSITSAQVTNGLGFTPYNATNPTGYITSSGAPVQSVAGRTGAVVLGVADVSGAAAQATTYTKTEVDAAIAAAITAFAATLYV
jgi:hypothetical protein